MKNKFIVALLGIAMVFCLAGCGGSSSTASTTGGSSSSSDGYTFTYDGTKIAMKADFSTIIDKLGDYQDYQETESCAFDGLDKTYTYADFVLVTYPDGDIDRVNQVWFLSDNVETEEGIALGDDKDAVEKAYGSDGFDGSSTYKIDKGETELTIKISDDAVTDIMYSAVFN